MTKSNRVVRAIQDYKKPIVFSWYQSKHHKGELEDMTGWFKQWDKRKKPHPSHQREHRGEREYAKGYWR